jgi:hypothetical protein
MAVAEAEIVSVIIAIIAQIRAECKGRIFWRQKTWKLLQPMEKYAIIAVTKVFARKEPGI